MESDLFSATRDLGMSSISDVKRVTLEDVARHAGVSRAAASLVVRGTGRLSNETRDRVRASMVSLGYVYHRGAATLRTQKSCVIGLLVTDISNPFFSAMTLGFERLLIDAGYFTMVSNTFDDADRQGELVRTMLEHPVEALAYVPVIGNDPGLSGGSPGTPPAVAVTRRPSADAAYIGPDDHTGGRLAAEHVVTVHRRRRLVYLGGPELASPRVDRLAGARSVVERHADAKLVAEFAGQTSVKSGTALATELVRSDLTFDAVLCHSDVVAYALIHVLRRSGVSLDSVSVIGFDGLPESRVFEPTITTVTAGPERVGELAAQWTLDRLRGAAGSAQAQLLEPRLDVRASCGCAVGD